VLFEGKDIMNFRKLPSIICLMLMFVITSKNIAHAEIPNSFAEIVRIASPAVVNISTTIKAPEEEQFASPEFPLDPFLEFYRRFEREMRPRNQKLTSLGSGFIISADGLIVTNNHIVNEAEEIKVTLADDSSKKYTAKLIGADPKTDIALLKIEVTNPLPYIVMGDSNASQVGDWVITIGNPFGFLGGTVTAGIISAKARNLNSGLEDFIQTDAAINKGNSGGPMLNTKGEVIGINTALISTNTYGGNIGIGFAISSAMAKPIIEQLRSKGSVLRGWLGVVIQNVGEDLMDAFDSKALQGVVINDIMENSPAARAKLRIGDVIISYNNSEIKTAANLQKLVAETSINSIAKLKIVRDGKVIEVDVKIASQSDMNTPSSPEGSKMRENLWGAEKASLFGMELTNLTDDLRHKYGIDRGHNGVLITSVKKDSDAEASGFKPGDIIMRVGPESIRSVSQLKARVEKIRSLNKNKIPLFVLRNDAKQYMVLIIKKK
jgi:serine protease Do